jgi:hypothetical protein
MTMTTKKTIRAKASKTARGPRTLSWTAQEYAPRHRWWWHVIVAIVTLYVSGFLVLADQWSTGALIFVAGLALIVFSADRPRLWRYKLKSGVLTVEGDTRMRPITLTWDLRDFKAVTLEQITRSRNEAPFELLVLVGRRRLSWPRDIYLSGDDVKDLKILDAFSRALPLEQIDAVSTPSRVLQRLARLLGLT